MLILANPAGNTKIIYDGGSTVVIQPNAVLAASIQYGSFKDLGSTPDTEANTTPRDRNANKWPGNGQMKGIKTTNGFIITNVCISIKHPFASHSWRFVHYSAILRYKKNTQLFWSATLQK